MIIEPRLLERLYLDFDSFFASAEQHFNPDLRGVKTNMPAREARKIIPDMVFVVARPDVYEIGRAHV